MQGSTTISSTSLVACYNPTEQKLATAQQQTVGKTDLDQKLDKKVQWRCDKKPTTEKCMKTQTRDSKHDSEQSVKPDQN